MYRVTEAEMTIIANMLADILVRRMTNCMRCKKCGWIGARKHLIPTGGLAALTCPRCPAQLCYGEMEESQFGFQDTR